MFNKSLFIIILACAVFQQLATSQQPLGGQPLMDSLLMELPKQKADTVKANLLNSIGKMCLRISEFEKGLEYCHQALTLSERLFFKRGIADSHHIMGMLSTNQGNYGEALEHNEIALKLNEELGDQKGMAGSFNNIGLVYQNVGNYKEALKMYYSALKINESMKNSAWVAGNYNNIGIIYLIQEEYPAALKNLTAALEMQKQLGNRFAMDHPYNNIGSIYFNLGDYTQALKNYEESYKIRQEIGDKFEIANIISNIALVHVKRGNYREAEMKFEESFKIYQEIGDKSGIASYYNNIGDLNTILKKYTLARSQFEKSKVMNYEIGSLEGIKNIYGSLADLDSASGNYKGAYSNYKKYVIYKDSLINEENTKQLVQQQMQYDFDKKETLAKAEQEKKDAVASKELQKQKLVRNGFMGGFAIVIIFAGVFFKQRNKIKKGKKRSDELLLNILPAETAEELKNTGTTKAKDFSEVTVLFTDFKNFTSLSENLTAQELVNEINYCYSAFDTIITNHGIEKIKTIGDSYMCASGLPVANKTNAEDTVRAALEIRDFIEKEKQIRISSGRPYFDIRIGCHTGPVVAGIVGIKKFAYDIWGDTVNIASRMESSGEAGKINVSGSTYQLVHDKFRCEHRGKIEAKNKGMIDMYFVESK